MKNHIFSIGLLAALAISCSIHEMDFKETNAIDEFYASIENADSPDTKVYATEELYLRWNADDRITIFNKYTYNQEYRFTGETGDNSGSFKRVDNGDFVTGNSLDNIYAIYPYLESTRISDTGVITVTIPAEQDYAEKTMGLGANTMISATTDNQLLFKNVGGYLMLRLYGDDVTVSSISLKGNNGERIAGKATVSMPINGVPTVAMSETAGQETSLICNTPVKIGTTAATATTFWLVVPPTVFSKGFTLTVKDNKNGVFEKATSKSFEISRNTLSRMTALEVVPQAPDPSDDAIVFADERVKERLVAAFDTNDDGQLSYKEAAAVTSGEDIKAALGAIKTYKSFDEFQYFINVPNIPISMFEGWNLISTIVLPESITTIEHYAFRYCVNMKSIYLPESVSYIGYGAFNGCESLKRITIPPKVTSLSHYDSYTSENPDEKNKNGVFYGCSSLEEVILPDGFLRIGIATFMWCSNLSKITIPKSVKEYGQNAFAYCESLSTEIVLPENLRIVPFGIFHNCRNITSVRLHDKITTISACAFDGCGITSIEIPESVTFIGEGAFEGCSITAIKIPETISTIERLTFRFSALESIIIPESVTSIGQSAFYSCANLTSVIIPASVSIIGSEAFRNCGSLSSITINATTPPSGGSQAFNNTNNCPIYVPSESVDAYKSSWSNYADRIQAIPSVPIPEAVDLGLSVKWASFNLGASKPEEFGDYFAWGEIEPYYEAGYAQSENPVWKPGKEAGYTWTSYKWCMGTNNSMTKYCINADYGYNGFTDDKTVLDHEDDAAHVNLGGKWRIPTKDEWSELANHCTISQSSLNGITCLTIIGSNGNQIVLPKTGRRLRTNIDFDSDLGRYWSSTVCEKSSFDSATAYFFLWSADLSHAYPYCGFSIRPVCD